MRDASLVNWSSIHHAYGAASDIPALLEKVTKLQREGAFEAFIDLRGKVCHQGVVIGEATSYVLDYLIDIVRSGESPIRVELFKLVENISNASTAWRSAARNASPERRANYSRRISWELAVEDKFVNILSSLELLTADPNPEVRRIAESLVVKHADQSMSE
ncbi:hypothetical protein [Spirillospora sp. CA-294931]|uniref:hypothetical protein n=1 Tax=Spirillospora sp. CA-294931 TaxID=3240042 RepID=UPI003D90F8BA